MVSSLAVTVDPARALAFAQRRWDESIVPALVEYIRIPARSPAFDRQWREHGHLERAVGLIHDWARAPAIDGLRVEVVRLEGRTPVIVMEVPGPGDDTVLPTGVRLTACVAQVLADHFHARR
jgi:hypothetical protein